MSIQSSAFEYTYNGHTLSYSIRNSFPVKTCEVSINRYLYGNLTIPSIAIYNGEEYHVTSICEGAFSEWNSGLESVVIPNSIGRIGSKSFSNCWGLKKFIIEDGDDTIYFGANVFSGDAKLTQLYIGKTIALIEGTDATSGPFYEMNNLKQITIGDSVTNIASYAFFGTGLTSVETPNSVTRIDPNAFSNCSSLKKFKIADGETAIKFGSDVFHYSWIQTLYIGRDFSYSGQYDYSASPFSEMTSLQSLSIGNSVTSIGAYAFFNCSRLTSVRISGSVALIGAYAFENCINLNTAEFESIEGLCTIKFENRWSNPIYFANQLYIDGQKISNLAITDSVTSIGQFAFAGCKDLTTVSIPNSVKSIGSSAFFECTGIKTVDIPNSVTSIGSSAFAGCKSITSVRIPNLVHSIGSNAFNQCDSIRDVYYNSLNPLNSVKDNTFSDSIYSKATLWVPAKSVAKFKDISPWSKFHFIQSYEFEDTPTILVQSIQLDPRSWSGIEGDTFTISASVYPSDATSKELEWSLSNEEIGFLDATGTEYTFYAKKTGKTTITCRSTDGSDVMATCDVEVFCFGDEEIGFSIDGQILEQESTVSIKSGETVLIDVKFYLKPTNPCYDNPTLNFSSDIIEVTELSQAPLDNSISGYKRRYAVKGLNHGESAFVFFAYNTAGRIWIDVTDNSGIDQPEVDESHVQPIYYDLQGNKISGMNLLPGIYIKKTGSMIEKVFIRQNVPDQ